MGGSAPQQTSEYIWMKRDDRCHRQKRASTVSGPGRPWWRLLRTRLKHLVPSAHGMEDARARAPYDQRAGRPDRPGCADTSRFPEARWPPGRQVGGILMTVGIEVVKTSGVMEKRRHGRPRLLISAKLGALDRREESSSRHRLRTCRHRRRRPIH